MNTELSTNQPTTQQDLIDAAAKDYEASYYKHRSKHADPQDHFTAGAEWALSNNEVMEGVMINLLRWIANREGEERLTLIDHNWYFASDEDEITSIDEKVLVKLYFEYLKQEEK